jgi:DNA-binding HxlR family transcriptional regulator
MAHQPVSGTLTDDLVPDGRGNDRAPSPDCPVETALAAIGGKWTTLVLRDLSRSALSYSELRAGLPALSDKVLTDRLHHLVEQGLVRRTVHRGAPNRTQYSLTESGQAVRPLLIELHASGTRLQALRQHASTMSSPAGLVRS